MPERRAQLHAHRAHRVVERGVLARVAGRGHPVGRELHVRRACAIGADGDVGDRLAHRQARRGRPRRGAPPACARPWPWPRRWSRRSWWRSPPRRPPAPATGPTIWSRATRPVTRAVADGDEEGLVGHRRAGAARARTASSQVEPPGVERCPGRRDPRSRRACMRGGLPSSTDERHVDGRGSRSARPRAPAAPRRSPSPDHREGAALARAERAEALEPLRRHRQHVALLRLVAPDLQRATCPARRSGSRRSSKRRPAPLSWTSSGSALDRPPAPTSWMETMGLSSPSAQQRSMTSWQRRCISALSRCTEAKSRSSRERARRHGGGRAAAQADEHGRAAEHHDRRRPARRSPFCTCSARMLPRPPAIMMGLW